VGEEVLVRSVSIEEVVMSMMGGVPMGIGQLVHLLVAILSRIYRLIKS
jgi:hypothetical protein